MIATRMTSARVHKFRRSRFLERIESGLRPCIANGSVAFRFQYRMEVLSLRDWSGRQRRHPDQDHGWTVRLGARELHDVASDAVATPPTVGLHLPDRVREEFALGSSALEHVEQQVVE